MDLKRGGAPGMGILGFVIKVCIGFIFTIYGGFLLLRNRKGKGKLVLSLVCVLVGLFLLGYAVYQLVSGTI